MIKNKYQMTAGFLFSITTLMLITALMSWNENFSHLLQWNFTILNSFYVSFPLLIESHNLLFAATVCFISANVFMFSNTYMSEEKENNQFIILVLMFILSMNLLIFIPNIMCLLIGWDGLGLVSFLLVIHYPAKSSLSAGYITIMSNRIGDALILITIPLLMPTLSMTPSSFLNPLMISTISALIITAAITKSAQIPFSAWLPAAMAAPTPISALVHSSTLVTAGIFLMYRFYPMINNSMFLNKTLMFLSIMTSLLAGASAILESDMKKIIALSTLSQLGVMVYSLAANLPELSFFHLLSHASFKALLFIAAGKMIFNFNHAQDLRQFGNTWKLQPFTSTVALITSLSLTGFPFLAGFYSKDLIIEMSLFSSFNTTMMMLLFLATLLTLSYSLRFTYMVFLSSSNMPPMSISNNTDKMINLPMTLMTVFVLISGAFLSWSVTFPYMHPNLNSANKYGLILSLFSVLIMTMLMLNNNNHKINFNIPKLNFILLLSFFSSQFIIKSFYPITNNIVKINDSGWNEMILGKSLYKNIFMPKAIDFKNWYSPLTTLGFTIALTLIFMSL